MAPSFYSADRRFDALCCSSTSRGPWSTTSSPRHPRRPYPRVSTRTTHTIPPTTAALAPSVPGAEASGVPGRLPCPCYVTRRRTRPPAPVPGKVGTQVATIRIRRVARCQGWAGGTNSADRRYSFWFHPLSLSLSPAVYNQSFDCI